MINNAFDVENPENIIEEDLPTLSLEDIIRKHLGFASFVLIILIMCFYVVIDISAEKERTISTAKECFTQIDSIMESNEADKEEVEEEYSASALKSAEAIAYILEKNPDAIKDIDELKKIAELCEIEEINIFDETGTIVYGTVPEYYGYNFGSGEQMSFFLPLLKDKSQKLVQEVTPNTAEGKSMQYSALWMDNGKYIVQIGINPSEILKATAKNQISYVFSQMQANPNILYYAVDNQRGKVEGASDVSCVDEKISRIIGQELDMSDIPESMTCNINGERMLCVFHEMEEEGLIIIYAIPNSNVYTRLPRNILTMGVSLILATVLLFISIRRNLNNLVVDSIDKVNEKLRKITRGNYDQRVDVTGSEEFEELSDHINAMVQSLLSNSENLSYTLSTSGMRIATYQYNKNSETVTIAGAMTSVLPLTEEEVRLIISDSKKFHEMIEAIKAHPFDVKDYIYRTSAEGEHYVKLKEKTNSEGTFGVIIDMTENILSLKRAEKERDTDILTGIANRRGMDAKIQELINNDEAHGLCAIVMIDVDNLKCINDNVGHTAGDKYIRTVAHKLRDLNPDKCYASRQGGDEFVLLIHNVTQDEIDEIMDKIDDFNDKPLYGLPPDMPLSFSYGLAVADDLNKYSSMFSKADYRMYENKKARKSKQCKDK